ncbi:MAG: helix-turn-helix transcriptional regulator [Pirellulales bacterium]
MTDYASNLRRLMARQGLTLDDVVARSGLDERTVKGILAGVNRPHARTLNRLASGLGVSADELFQDPSLLLHRLFDRRTNPLVEEIVDANPEVFGGWTEGDFDELYSRFGTGGALSTDGVLAAARIMQRNRQTHRRLSLLLESGEADLVVDLIDVMYRRIAAVR